MLISTKIQVKWIETNQQYQNVNTRVNKIQIKCDINIQI